MFTLFYLIAGTIRIIVHVIAAFLRESTSAI